MRSEVFQASYTMFTWRDHHGDRSQLQLWLPLSHDRVRSVLHELNIFHSCDRACNCSTDYTIWSQSPWPLKWCDTWNVEETLKLRNCKKNLSCSLANGPQRIWKEGTAWRLMLLCFGCTLVVQCERTVVLQSTEMQNFSAAECGKAIRSNLRNVQHLIFRKLPLDNFPQSAFRKIPAPSKGVLDLRNWNWFQIRLTNRLG